MRRTLIGWLAVCVIAVAASVSGQTIDPIAAARSAETPSARARAIGLLRDRLTSAPDDADAARWLGVVLARDGQYDEARTLLQGLRAKYPRDVDVVVALANVELWSQHPQQAREIARQGLAFAPNDPELQRGLDRALDQLALGRRWTLSAGHVLDTFSDSRYAGAPMTTPDGFALGTLCVIDRVPRALTPEQSEALQALSRQAMAQIELRRRNAEAEAALSEAEALGRLRSQFVSMVSHELRTPLTSMRGGLQLALADVPEASMPDTHELLAGALTSTERLIRLTNDILDESKFEAGKLELRRTSHRIEDIVTAACAAVAHLPGTAGRVDVAVEPGLPPVVVDADRVIQALVNLLSNAVKFSPADANVMLRVRSAGGGIECAVTDRGLGISGEDLTTLFQPFRQLAAGAKLGGTGLGLVITRHIVEQHGGTIRVESALGHGATFTIWLPTT